MNATERPATELRGTVAKGLQGEQRRNRCIQRNKGRCGALVAAALPTKKDGRKMQRD